MSHRGPARRSKRKLDKFVDEATSKAIDYLSKELEQLLASNGNYSKVISVTKALQDLRQRSEQSTRRRDPSNSRRGEFDFGALEAQEARENQAEPGA